MAQSTDSTNNKGNPFSLDKNLKTPVKAGEKEKKMGQFFQVILCLRK